MLCETTNGSESRICCHWSGRQRRGDGERQSPVCGSCAVPLPSGHSLARSAGALWPLEGRAYPIQPVGGQRRLGEGVSALGGRGGQRIGHDRQHHCPRSPAQCGRSQKDGAEQAIGRSRGGLSTKIHATVDALGNPTGFLLTPGQACDREGADVLLSVLEAPIVIADKGYDADERVLQPLAQAGKTAVIPPQANRKTQRAYDKDLYQARHLVENFFCQLKQFRAIATRYDKTARNFLAAVYAAAITIRLN
jgi:transposase